MSRYLDELFVQFLEALHRLGQSYYYQHPPTAVSYWQGRIWNREIAEKDINVGPFYKSQTSQILELIKYSDVTRGKALDVGCGVGTFTKALAGFTDADEIDALDVSPHALEYLLAHCKDKRVRPRNMGFWDLDPANVYDLIVSVDAIHHLGYVDDVICRISKLLNYKGRLIGNLWTADNFQEFQILRYGRLGQLTRMLKFAYTGMLSTHASGADMPYRSHLIHIDEIEPILRSSFQYIKYLRHERYFSCFMCEGPK